MIGAISIIEDNVGLIVLLLIISNLVFLGLVLVLMRQWALLRKSVFIFEEGD